MLQGLGNLIVPLLCGYGFLTFCNYTKYRILRESGYHVLFRSAITGLTFLAVAHVAQEAARHFLPGNRTFLLLQNLIPIENPVTLAFTILLAVVSLALFNLKYDKVSAARKVAEQNGDFIELLIDRAITAGQSVELSLRSGKSYIGYALKSRLATLSDIDVELVPIASGYRKSETRELKITTHYSSVMLEFESKNYMDFRIVIPMSEIESVRLFDKEVYDRFQQSRQSDDLANE